MALNYFFLLNVKAMGVGGRRGISADSETKVLMLSQKEGVHAGGLEPAWSSHYYVLFFVMFYLSNYFSVTKPYTSFKRFVHHQIRKLAFFIS